ncbi:MAG: ester cyclase [Myxococcota bacterium]|nr:ester cyclase [Myxococcota bacterium]
MKLRSMTMVMMGVGALATGAACSKKPKEGKAPDIGSASNTMGSAGSGSAAPAEPPKEAKLEGKALADRYLECTAHINGAKWDDFKTKCLAKDYKGHDADGQNIEGPDAVLDWFKGQHTAFPDMKFQPQLVLVNGRNILAVGLTTGTHTGVLKSPMGEVPATNKKMGQLMFHRLTINDENRANQEWAYFDPATMASQLGLMPKGTPPMRAAMDKGMDGAPVVVVAADDDKEKKNLEAWQKSLAAFQSKKTADYMAFYTDDAIESDQAGEKDHKGKKEIQAGSEMFLKAFPDLKIETPNTFAAGDYVVAMGTFSGTNDGPLGPMKATKKKVTGEFAEVVKMKDGKIAELWRFRNGMSMASQLGLMGPPPGAGSAAPPAGGGSGSDAPKGDAPKGDAPKKG